VIVPFGGSIDNQRFDLLIRWPPVVRQLWFAFLRASFSTAGGWWPLHVGRSRAVESFPAVGSSKAVGPALVVTLHAELKEIPYSELVSEFLGSATTAKCAPACRLDVTFQEVAQDFLTVRLSQSPRLRCDHRTKKQSPTPAARPGGSGQVDRRRATGSQHALQRGVKIGSHLALIHRRVIHADEKSIRLRP